nr:cytochrome c oxidase subunit 6b-like protein new16 [Quercus suber]
MGLFSSATTTTPATPSPSQDGGFIAPDRTARAACWEARDAFFRCLDAAAIVDSVKDDAGARRACSKELVGFETNCASSWVTYFKKRRVMEHQRDLTIKRLSAEGVQAGDAGSVAER